MKTQHKIFTLAVYSVCATTPLLAEGYEHSLPLQVETKEQLYTYGQSGTGQVHVRSTNNLAFIKPGSSWNTGWSEAVIRFNDIPGFLNVHASQIQSSLCTSGSHNPVTISESNDGKSYTTIQQISSDKTHDLVLALKKETRYIKFYYNVPANGAFNKSYCSHGFDPMSISLPKSIDIQGANRKIQGELGQIIKDTILVDYSNPLGNLILESSNTAFSFRKISEAEEKGTAGTAQYEISFDCQKAGDFITTLTVKDAGYTEAYEEVQLTTTILGASAPDAPVNITSTDISFGSLSLAWDAVANVNNYSVILFDQEENRLNQYNTTTNNYTIEGLTPGKSYLVGIKAINEVGTESEISQLLAAATTEIPVPGELQSTTSGFDIISVTWNASENVQGYVIALQNTEGTLLLSDSIEQTSYTFRNLTPGTTYRVGLKNIFSPNYISALGNMTEVTTVAVPAPTNLNVSANRFNIFCNWTAPQGVFAQHIKVMDKENMIIHEDTVGAETTDYTFKGLSRGQHYSVSVNAVTEGGFNSSVATAPVETLKDFGTQLQNSGFDLWESASKGEEPNNWNSFASATGSMATFAKAEQVRKATDRRPGTDGAYAANLFTKTILGVTANGNLTTGRIYANSSTANDLSNYNAIVVGDPAFHQIVEEQPDSVSIWVKFAPANPDSEKAIARMSFILHSEGVVNEPSATVSDLIASQATYEWRACEWTRVSFPFEAKNSTKPKYMLASMTTNKTPGVGSGGTDNLFVDDLVLIYKPKLNIEPVSVTDLQEGDKFVITYTLDGTMSVSNLNAAPNSVYAELSDQNGSFSHPTLLCEPVTTDESGELVATLPTKMISGNNYRVRVVTTNYPMISEADQNLAISGSDIPNSLKTPVMAACKLYPNPAKDRIFISNANGAIYQIRNISNQMVASATYQDGGIDVSGLNCGIYVIDLKSASGIQKLKFIKE